MDGFLSFALPMLFCGAMVILFLVLASLAINLLKRVPRKQDSVKRPIPQTNLDPDSEWADPHAISWEDQQAMKEWERMYGGETDAGYWQRKRWEEEHNDWWKHNDKDESVD
jgi:hypothetical protein